MANLKLPNGTLGLIVSSTNEAQQEDLFFPCEPRLFAVNVAGDPECGSLVFDLNKANEPDSARGAYLQSAFRVVKLPLGQPNAIAFQLDLTGKKDTQGGFFCEIMQAPTQAVPNQEGGTENAPGTGGAPEFDLATLAGSGAQFTLDGGPGQTVVKGQEPPENGGFGFGEGSHNFGGPFHVGVTGDKHHHGDDADGNPINALHLWTSANFFMNKLADGPVRFELEWKEGKEKKNIVPCHLAWTGVDWAIWSSCEWYTPPGELETGKRPKDPFGGTIFNDNNPKFGQVQPVIPGVDAAEPGAEIRPYTIFNDNNPDFGPPIDGRVSGSGIPMGMVASLSAVMTPGLVMRPENYNTATQSTGLFDVATNQGRNNSDFQEQYSLSKRKADSSSPITAMASAFGAQGGFVDAGGSGSGTTHGGEGDPWLYTQVPRGTITSGKKTSLYPGGTASGGIIYHPPETDLRDIDSGMVPDNVTLSETRIMCAPGASFGVGIPNLETGSIKTGANWVYDSDTGDAVWHTYSFTTESEALRLTNPAQLIRWMSGQSFYGEFSHTNTANQTWTFPDVTATIGAVIFDSIPPTTTAPEGTFAWDTAAENLYVNSDGSTSWVFIGGASGVTGSGAAGRVAIWSSATALTADADLTFSGSTTTATNLIVTTGLTNSALTSGRVTFASTAGLLADDAGFTFDGITLTLSDGHSTTTPLHIINNSSTGDAATRWTVGTTASYIAGIDNDDSDTWKVCYAANGTAVLGTNDYFKITTNGDIGINMSSGAPAAKLQVVTSGDITGLIIGEQSVVTGKQLTIGYFTTSNIAFIQSVHQGTDYTPLHLNPSGGEVVINDGGGNYDGLRVESDDEAYCLMVEGTLNNIVLCANAEPGFNTMDGGVFLAEANVVPTGNPTAGIYIYVEGGAGKARGTGGTITTWAPAEPHCEVCGTDYGHEWENSKWGRLQFCVNCLADDVAKRNGGELPKWIKREKVA